MLKFGKLAIAGTIAGMTVVPNAHADIKADMAACDRHAKAMTAGTAGTSAQSAAVRGLAGILGAAVGGRTTEYAAERGVRGVINGTANDVNRESNAYNTEYRKCMRQKQKELSR